MTMPASAALLVAVGLVVASPSGAHAEPSLGAGKSAASPGASEAPGAPVSAPPSAFDAGIDGFGMGIFAGVAGGYLVAREGGLHARDWRPLVAGAGIGALTGGALGLTFGLVNTDAASKGRTYLIMRGMGRGGQFGLLAGGIIGGLVALSNDHPENILFGAAIGTLSGTAVGLIVGSLERNPWAPPRVGQLALQLGVAPCPTARGELSWGPSLTGRF